MLLLLLLHAVTSAFSAFQCLEPFRRSTCVFVFSLPYTRSPSSGSDWWQMFKSHITAAAAVAYCVSCRHVSKDDVAPP